MAASEQPATGEIAGMPSDAKIFPNWGDSPADVPVAIAGKTRTSLLP